MKKVAYTFATKPTLHEGLIDMMTNEIEGEGFIIIEFEVEDDEEQEMLEDELNKLEVKCKFTYEEI